MNNSSHLIRGRVNESPLSERGILQSQLLLRRFLSEKVIFDEVYASPALRTIDTAYNSTLNEEIISDDRLQELDQGDWTGRLRNEVYTPETLARINSNNWDFTPPNGESQRIVEERMMDFVRKTFLVRAEDNLCAGIFTHGTATKCLLRGVMDFLPSLTYKIVLDNTSITRLKYNCRGWHVFSVNDTAHLLGKERITDSYC